MPGIKKKSWIIGGLAVALVATGALAAKNRFDGRDRAAHMTERVTQRLDLNDSQKTSFEKVIKTYGDIKGTSPEFMLQLKGKLKELAADETLTVAEVNTLRDEIKAEFDRRADVMIPEFVNFYNTLDPEQRAEVVASLDKIGGRFGTMQRFGMHRHHDEDHHEHHDDENGR